MQEIQWKKANWGKLNINVPNFKSTYNIRITPSFSLIVKSHGDFSPSSSFWAFSCIFISVICKDKYVISDCFICFSFLLNGIWDPHILFLSLSIKCVHVSYTWDFLKRHSLAALFLFFVAWCWLLPLFLVKIRLTHKQHNEYILEKFSPCHEQAYAIAFWFDSIVIYLKISIVTTVFLSFFKINRCSLLQ